MTPRLIFRRDEHILRSKYIKFRYIFNANFTRFSSSSRPRLRLSTADRKLIPCACSSAFPSPFFTGLSAVLTPISLVSESRTSPYILPRHDLQTSPNLQFLYVLVSLPLYPSLFLQYRHTCIHFTDRLHTFSDVFSSISVAGGVAPSSVLTLSLSCTKSRPRRKSSNSRLCVSPKSLTCTATSSPNCLEISSSDRRAVSGQKK